MQLRNAKITDLYQIAHVWHAAFFDDEIIGNIMHPNRIAYPDDVYYWLLRGIRERYFDWRHQFVVVTKEVDGQEVILGAAEWRRLGQGGKKMELGTWDPRSFLKPSISLFNRLSLLFFPNRAMDPTRDNFLERSLSKSAHHWMGDRAECWDLHVCGVHPNYHHQGIGKQLVRWGIQRADEEEVCASVVCGQKNRAFYIGAGLETEVEDTRTEEKKGSGGKVVLFKVSGT
ncbi:hypothetical protein M501DRAFT_599492 [Patellaria atrata CBS 101060]|uniref:N-acetyltransferase domain-containing protein n=1 Tax=Patellaria atrata CBS 101060 TaxID=1346257 RepID=A0A9P4VLM9_9PEZI|nr:hypothetical protein M501DRAFT_599492 [Patellaria atrata CBS 101060]